MKPKWILIANAVVFGPFGVFSLVAPSVLLTLWGIEQSEAARLCTQFCGVGSLGIALVSWFIRNIEEQGTIRPVLLSFMASYLVGTVISILGITSGIMTAGWIVLGIFSLFTCGFAWSAFTVGSGKTRK